MSSPGSAVASVSLHPVATHDTSDPIKRIAYLTSRFPKLTETFVLVEILELQRLGLAVEIFPLVHQKIAAAQPEVAELDGAVHAIKPWSRQVLGAQLHWLRRRPGAYVNAWWSVLHGLWRSPKFLSRALITVPLAATFAREIEALGIRHVHAHWATHPALATFVIRRLTGTPYSFTAHAHDLYVDQTMLREKIEEAAFVVTISQHNRRFMADFCDPQQAAKIKVIRCGVDPAVFHPDFRRRRGGPFTIVCIAAYEPKKGHSYLLDACAALRAGGLDFSCLLVGDGPERSNLARQIDALDLRASVEIVGGHSWRGVRELLGRADVAVLPSIVLETGKREGIPVALMEASAMALPVVATNISGVPELVEDGATGLLVPERDAPALAEAIQRLAADPGLREHLGAAARKKVVADFNLQRNVRELHQLFEPSWDETQQRSPSNQRLVAST